MAGKPIRAILAWALALATLVVCSVPARAGMSVLDEDTLSDVQCKAGLALIARMRTTGGTMRITSTGYLEINTWQINNGPGAGGFAQLGYPATPGYLDWGIDGGTNNYVRLTLPNNFGDANAPSGQARLFLGKETGPSTYERQDVGMLSINRIYNNQSRWTLGGNADGFKGAFEFHMDVDQITIYKGTNAMAGVCLEDSWMYGLPTDFGSGSGLPSPFSGFTHAPTSPSDTDMYCSFGILPNYPMQVDLYTLAIAPDAGQAIGSPNFYDTRMRISYAVQGTYRVQNSHIGPSSDGTAGTWANSHNYGPILMDNFHPVGGSGGVVIELPVTSSFYPDT